MVLSLSISSNSSASDFSLLAPTWRSAQTLTVAVRTQTIDHDEGKPNRHKSQQPADQKQHDDEQQGERHIEQRRREVSGKQLTSDLELAEARQLRGERCALGQREGQVEDGCERSNRNDGVEARRQIGDRLGSWRRRSNSSSGSRARPMPGTPAYPEISCR